MSRKLYKVLVKLPGEDPEVRKIEATYEAVREIIGTWLELIPGAPQADSGVMYYCADDGKHRGMAPNIMLVDRGGHVLDSEGHEFEVIVGPIVVAKYGPDDLDMRSLTEDEIAFHTNWLNIRRIKNDK